MELGRERERERELEREREPEREPERERELEREREPEPERERERELELERERERMKTDRVLLTKDEARWLSRNVSKTKTILEARSKNDPEIVGRSTYKTLAYLAPQAGEIATILDQLGEESFELELVVTKKHRGVVRFLIEKTIRSLSEVILPTYQQRGLEDYVNDTKTKIRLLKNMVRKF